MVITSKRELKLVEYRGQDDSYDELMGVPILRFQSIEALRFDLSKPARYIIEDPQYTLPLDLLFYPRAGSKKLLVGFHGAEMRAIADLPKFQFVRSFKERSESLLFVSDTTLLQSPTMSLGWLAGNSQTPLGKIVAVCVRLAGEAVGAHTSVLVGHSAGGFMAMLVGSLVPNSRAISINGQVSLDHHREWTNTSLRKAAFSEFDTNAEMLEAYPERFDLRHVLRNRAKNSTFTYFGHEDDRLTMTDHPHFPLLAAYLGLPVNGGLSKDGDALVPCWWEVKGSAHALPGTVNPFLQLVLQEPNPARRVEYRVNPTWQEDNSESRYPLEISVDNTGVSLVPLSSLQQGGHNAPINTIDNLAKEPLRIEGAFRLQTELDRETCLDALVVNKKSDTLVVTFHGATSRQDTELPRFERLNTMLKYDVSSMFFSDPALQLDPTIQLAWFTGWQTENLQWRIAQQITQVAVAIGARKILLTGSSGGGFAALQVSALLPKSTALAFNAQTDISTYRINGTSWAAVRKYVATVWPELLTAHDSLSHVESGSWSVSVDDRISALRRYARKQDNKVYIVQNKEEFHYEEHFLPFLELAKRSGKEILHATNAEGTMHNPPRAETFKKAFEEVLTLEGCDAGVEPSQEPSIFLS